MTTTDKVPRLPLEWLHGGAIEAKEDILAFYRRCEEQGGLVKTHIWRLPIYVVTAPEVIEEVLIRSSGASSSPADSAPPSSPSARGCSPPTRSCGSTSARRCRARSTLASWSDTAS
jgi:hypothetical protein